MVSRHTVGEMSRDELKTLIREVMEEILWEMEQRPGPDDELLLKPEITAYLGKALEEKSPFYSLSEVKKKLGLDE